MAEPRLPRSAAEAGGKAPDIGTGSEPLRSFRWLLVSAASSNLGDGLRLAALPLLAASLTREPLQIAAVTAAIWLPWVVLGFVGGVVVDRVDQPRLVVRLQLCRLLVIAALGVVVLTDVVDVWAIYLVAFVIGAGEVFVDSATQTLIPTTVPRGRLEAANGKMLAAETIGNELAGPPVGSVLFAIAPAAPFFGDAVSYGVSAAAARKLSGTARSQASAENPIGRPALWHSFLEGVRYIAGHPYLRAITVWGAAFNVGSTAAFSLLVLYVLDVLDVGEPFYGVLLGITAIGGLLGTAVAQRAARRYGRGRTMLVGMLTSSGAVALLAVTTVPWVATVLLLISSLFGVVVNVVGRSVRQALVPHGLLGRSYSSGRVFVYGAMPIGAALGGWLGTTWGVATGFGVGGLIMLSVSIPMIPVLREERLRDLLTAAEQAPTGI